MRTVRVGLESRGYDVVIGHGLLARAAELAARAGGGRIALVSDETVHALYGAAIERSLGDRLAGSVVLPAGEQTKSFEHLADLSGRLLDMRLDRRDLLLALGGGVIGDLTGFAAAIYKRGVGFIQVPTTLLAQVDSSVGGKTAIDMAQGKNLIGAFHQPLLVLADLDALATLPDREMRSGYAEVLKYGLLGDAGFFAWLEANGPAVLAREASALEHAVARCVEMKAAIVAEDEHETTGSRALLNLGHTFGHALETETGHGQGLTHGEAVALGCALAFAFSAAAGLCSADAAARAGAAIARAGLPTQLGAASAAPLSADRLLGHMMHDKKADGGLTLILARSIGHAFVAKAVDGAAVRRFLIAQGAAA
jgi:3-dehydroquinate synthase